MHSITLPTAFSTLLIENLHRNIPVNTTIYQINEIKVHNLCNILIISLLYYICNQNNII